MKEKMKKTILAAILLMLFISCNVWAAEVSLNLEESKELLTIVNESFSHCRSANNLILRLFSRVVKEYGWVIKVYPKTQKFKSMLEEADNLLLKSEKELQISNGEDNVTLIKLMSILKDLNRVRAIDQEIAQQVYDMYYPEK